jgi:hypothetical protein
MALEAEDKAPNRRKVAHWKGPGARALMSALGHTPTFRTAIAMSAFPPKADVNRHSIGLHIA